jgi:hypothetical protein
MKCFRSGTGIKFAFIAWGFSSSGACRIKRTFFDQNGDHNGEKKGNFGQTIFGYISAGAGLFFALGIFRFDL